MNIVGWIFEILYCNNWSCQEQTNKMTMKNKMGEKWQNKGAFICCLHTAVVLITLTSVLFAVGCAALLHSNDNDIVIVSRVMG